jgi:3-deoxy-D-manno-octulosonic-acid transferase
LARELLSAFSPVLAQTPADAARFGALGARLALCLGNLKDAAAPLPADPGELARLREATAGRPVFLAASTHPGEEAIVLDAHRRMAGRLPGLLTVIVPRHPHRGAAVAAEAEGLASARRAAGETPGPGAAVYVADTLGELGLFYRLAGACLVGGSLVPHGGQNPLEPARLGCPILLGPHTANFVEPVARVARRRRGAAGRGERSGGGAGGARGGRAIESRPRARDGGGRRRDRRGRGGPARTDGGHAAAVAAAAPGRPGRRLQGGSGRRADR